MSKILNQLWHKLFVPRPPSIPRPTIDWAVGRTIIAKAQEPRSIEAVLGLSGNHGIQLAGCDGIVLHVSEEQPGGSFGVSFGSELGSAKRSYTREYLGETMCSIAR